MFVSRYLQGFLTLINTLGKIATAVVVIIYSYFAQRNYSFKTVAQTPEKPA